MVARGESVGGGMKFDDSLVLDGSLTRADTNITTDLKMGWLYSLYSRFKFNLDVSGIWTHIVIL
jgi:hypothetical protein